MIGSPCSFDEAIFESFPRITAIAKPTPRAQVPAKKKDYYHKKL